MFMPRVEQDDPHGGDEGGHKMIKCSLYARDFVLSDETQ
jgi:hypothetical protein